MEQIYRQKCIDHCQDRYGVMIDFKILQNKPPIFECTCKMQTWIEKIQMHGPDIPQD
jgi:hypothetical protein